MECNCQFQITYKDNNNKNVSQTTSVNGNSVMYHVVKDGAEAWILNDFDRVSARLMLLFCIKRGSFARKCGAITLNSRVNELLFQRTRASHVRLQFQLVAMIINSYSTLLRCVGLRTVFINRFHQNHNRRYWSKFDSDCSWSYKIGSTNYGNQN